MDPRIGQWQQRIRAAGRQGTTLWPTGHDSLALAPASAGARLNLGDFQGVVEYEPGELAITVRAGTRWQDLLHTLAEHRQIPACAPLLHRPGRSVGGVVATGLNGPGRPWLGDVRGAVLGVAMLNGRGQLLTFGGRVMKNVAGFDLSRLQAGAWGRFGPLLEISLRTRPAFPATACRALELPLEQVQATVRRLWQAPVTGLAWHRGRLHVRLQGLEAGIRATLARLGGEEDPDFWPAHESLQLPLYQQRPLYRMLLPQAAAFRAPVLSWLGGLNDILVDWAGGLVWFSSEEPREALRRRAEVADGWMHPWPLQAAPQAGGSATAVTERLAQAFDPHGVFRPPRLETGHADAIA